MTRPNLAIESDLTRLVRTLLRALRASIFDNVGTAVALDYDDTPEDGLRVVAMAKLPALVVSAPTLRDNRVLRTSELRHEAVSASEAVRFRSPRTMDLVFPITAASTSTAELLNLANALVTFVQRTPWLEMPRDPNNPSLGTVRWPLDAEGDLRSDSAPRNGVHGLSWALVVSGFDLAEDVELDRGPIVRAIDVYVSNDEGSSP